MTPDTRQPGTGINIFSSRSESASPPDVSRGYASPNATYFLWGCAPRPASGPAMLGAKPEPGAEPHCSAFPTARHSLASHRGGEAATVSRESRNGQSAKPQRSVG